jgi:xylan 1,4-beta-xylosidase
MSQNPVLPGFHPDPSIIRVDGDYYLATSTFEWYPGVRIYHSQNLIDWELVATPLNRLSQLDMRGHPDSCGVWAPCLSYSEGVFYLVYTNTSRYSSHCKDTPNYLVTTTDIQGDWSEPVYLNSSGFDPSLFHDDDGRKWLLNMLWDHRQREPRAQWDADKYFGGIVLQEYDPVGETLTGQRTVIYPGSELGKAEGPHLYRRDGYYYLLVAEGGTGMEHACTMARSRQLTGPYEIDPEGPLLTSAGSPEHPLQRSGHGDIVTTPEGETWMVHLCTRPLANGLTVLGRETALQKIKWNEGWPRLASGGTLPEIHLPGDTVVERKTVWNYDFNGGKLHSDFQTLRCPLTEDILTLGARPGYLRLYGRESLGSLFQQALVARRQQAHNFEATTEIEFKPDNFQQMAGLVCYYNSSKYHYLFIGHDEELGRVLDVISCKGDQAGEYLMPRPITLPATGGVRLRVIVQGEALQFLYAIEADAWQPVPGLLDHSLLSDEVGDGGEHANFTGAFVGLCCQDLSGEKHPADFSFFQYKELATALAP